jgi:hypothetical protein
MSCVTFCVIFQFLTKLNAIVGAGTASRYGFGSGSDQMIRLLAAPAPEHREKGSVNNFQSYFGLVI